MTGGELGLRAGLGGNAVLRYDRAPGRRDGILARVRRAGFCSVTDLAHELRVSDMTIRRDLRRLERDGEVRMVHGGVSLAHATLRTSEFTTRASVNAAAKERIARAAVAGLGAQDVVALDAGTTAFAVATALPKEFHGYVVTHSVPVIQHLLHVPTVRVTGLGGELYPPSQAFVGAATIEQARRLSIGTFFLGVAAADERGVYVEADLERDLKDALMEAADEVVVVVDAAKFDRCAPVRLCGWERLDRVVTDAPPPAAARRAVRARRVELIVAR